MIIYEKLNLNNKLPVIFMLLCAILYISPYMINGKDSYILIHDNIDSVFVTTEVLANSDNIFSSSDTTILQLGLPRLGFGSELSVVVLLFSVFSAFTAYVINLFLIKMIAFVGTYYLIIDNFKDAPYLKCIAVGVAGCFALLPFFNMAGLSVAGIPLTLWALKRIFDNEERYFHWLIVILMPFYSGFVYSYMFLLGLLFSVFFICWYKSGVIRLKYLVSLCAMLLLYFLVEYRLILNALDSLYVPHRMDFLIPNISFAEALARAYENFIYGQYHAASLHTVVIIPCVILSILFGLFSRDKDLLKFLLLMLLLIAGISFFYGFWKWEGIAPIKESILFLNTINFARFHWLHPVLWHIAFAISLIIILSKMPRLIYFLIPIMLIQAWFVGVHNHEYVTEKERNGISYERLMSENLFNDIAEYIDKEKNQYKVVSLGVHPAIAIHNGFYTADFYMNYYPLEYKRKFREVIKNEIEKDAGLLAYYDNWGSRVYLFSHELGKNYLYNKSQSNSISIDLNVDALRELKVKYIFSTVLIRDSFELLKKFEDKDSHWVIYLYEV